MYKLLLLLFLGIFVLVPFSSAEELRQESRGYTCLDFDHCSGDGSGDKNRECEPLDDDAVHTSVHWGHRSQISLDNLEGLPAGSEVLVTECIDTGVNITGDEKVDTVCTTGDSKMDKFLFCGDENAAAPSCDHYTQLKADPVKYGIDKRETHGIYYLKSGKFVKSIGEKIPVGTDGTPTIKTIEWESHTPGNLNRKFIGWYFTSASATPTQIPLTNSPSVSPGAGGQQQAILTFPNYIPSPTSPAPDVKGCKGKPYDPYGRVFDMKSLEPIPYSKVLLKLKNPEGIFSEAFAKSENIMIDNPFITGEDGQFTFFVVDGDYQLSLVELGNTYTHPSTSEQSSLHPNTQSIYSDFYYNNSPAILQRGALEHRDIPLMPKNGIGETYELKPLVEDWILSVDGSAEYSGKVSHPYAELIIESCSNNNDIEVCNNPVVYGRTTGGPNKFGNFTVRLDQTLLQSGEYYKRSFRKVDLTTIKLSNNFNFNFIANWLLGFTQFLQPQKVFAQEDVTQKASLTPIVTYIEGFAYDAIGNIMPNAQVNILVPLSDVPVYQTYTNEKGYYKITSEYLPNSEYSIVYLNENTDLSKANKVSTSQFLSQNKEFIAVEKVNPYLTTTSSSDPRRNIIPSYIPVQRISATPQQTINIETSPSDLTPTINPESSNNSLLLIGAILLLLVATAGTLIGVYLYRKRTADQEM